EGPGSRHPGCPPMRMSLRLPTFTLALAALAVLVFAACEDNGNNGDASNGDATATTTQTASPTTTGTASPTDEATASPTATGDAGGDGATGLPEVDAIVQAVEDGDTD